MKNKLGILISFNSSLVAKWVKLVFYYPPVLKDI